MIIVDGRQTDLQITNFSNLEEILVSVMEDSVMENRVVTDVLVNKEQFSEIYPHQAEDIGSDFIESVEVLSVPVKQMGLDIVGEMETVAKIMVHGSQQIARLFRQANDTEGLELLQDLLDVTRDFMTMIEALRTEFKLEKNTEISTSSEKLSSLLSEMSEVLENEDWVLFADLLEYEFLPTCENWQRIIQILHADIEKSSQQ